MQLTLITEKNLQEKYFLAKTLYLFSDSRVLNLCDDENVHRYTTTKELKKMSFKINSQNI